MKRRVVITGLGVVTSLSCKVDDLWDRVLAGESGIHELRLFDNSDFKVKFAGDVWDWKPVDYISPKEIKRKQKAEGEEDIPKWKPTHSKKTIPCNSISTNYRNLKSDFPTAFRRL